MLFINVYLPCRSSAHCEEEFIDCLTNIMLAISDLHYTSIIFGGDMNIDITETNVLSNVLVNFVHDLGLRFLTINYRQMNVTPSECFLLVPPPQSIILL